MRGSNIQFVRLESGKLRDGLILLAFPEDPVTHVEAADAARIVRRLCREELAVEIGQMGQRTQDNMAHCRISREIAVRLVGILLA
jgi:hypothetical protein